jgi:predicted lipoprotein with Yx(FWY)xxD motif
MRHPRTVVASVGLAAAAIAGVTIAATAGGSTPKPSATPASTVRTTPMPPTTPGSAPATWTIHTAQATVGGTTETILVNQKGLPLYTYKPDTASTSMVTGSLAALWPPLDATAPTETGATGSLKVVNTANGHQVTYNGHFLYTFVEDSAGQVTGQGVQNFFVATPGLAAISGTPVASTSPASVRAPAPARAPAAAPAPAGNGFGY